MSAVEDSMPEWIAEAVKTQQKHNLLMFVRGREDVSDAVGRQITDDEWEAVRTTVAWRKGDDDEFIGSLINQIVWDAIAQANIDMEDM
jgi:hypothetical protein